MAPRGWFRWCRSVISISSDSRLTRRLDQIHGRHSTPQSSSNRSPSANTRYPETLLLPGRAMWSPRHFHVHPRLPRLTTCSMIAASTEKERCLRSISNEMDSGCIRLRRRRKRVSRGVIWVHLPLIPLTSGRIHPALESTHRIFGSTGTIFAGENVALADQSEPLTLYMD